MVACRSTMDLKTPRLSRRLGELGEEALDGVQEADELLMANA
jgi:hypothetical protein